MPGTAMRSFSVTSRSDLMAGLLVVMVMPPEAEPPSPMTSSFGLPLAFAHRVRKPPVPVEAMSMEPARIGVVDVVAAVDQEELGLDVAEAVRRGLLLQQASCASMT